MLGYWNPNLNPNHNPNSNANLALTLTLTHLWTDTGLLEPQFQHYPGRVCHHVLPGQGEG